MRGKKRLSLVVAFALLLTFFGGFAQAADWSILGTVYEAGPKDGRVYIVVENAVGAFWAANAIVAWENEILAVALTASAAGGQKVRGVYDTVAFEWKSLRLTNEP